MTREEYRNEMKPLSDLFNKDMTVEQHGLFFDKFSNVSAKAFKQVIISLMDNCQRFPTRSEIVRVCSEQSAWNTDRAAMPTELRRPPVSFECACGASFAIIADDLERADGEIKCPGEFYDLCNRTFPMELLRHAKKIAGKLASIEIGYAQ